ncbi:MAG: hypothetical protein A3B12_00495 [Candidatus Yanofskybacteria bacterium RIFCSPLOWO2_01_FULL_44_88]|nr:MAG: hypothetical protein A3B12_00495 [Candidatus Yanofskybacteria bacterium RIFCSPLOWO2_01_FULL_44_88]
MAKLLMITGLGSAKDLASGKKGAFYSTLEEFHKYWDRIDIIAPRIKNHESRTMNLFGNVFVHVSPWPLILHPFWFLKKGVEIYKEQKFDLMTVQEFPPFYNGIGARLLWHRIKVPYILEIMHIPGYPRAASFKEKFYRGLMKIFVKFDSAKAKTVRVINKKQTPDFLKKAGISERKLFYIPAFYIDLEVFNKKNVEKKYDLVFAARLEKNKGITNLIKAVELVKRQKPAVTLLVIGGGPLKQRLQEYIYKNGLSENIIFSGWLETAQDVSLAYNRAGIFVSPSLNEGGPRVALEAMACGLPIITTEVGLMPDIIKDGENGLFTGWLPEEIAEKIILLMNNGELQNKFSVAGMELVRQFEKRAAIKNYAEKLKLFI